MTAKSTPKGAHMPADAMAPSSDPTASLDPVTLHVLVVDVGGSSIKFLATGQEKRRKFHSGRQMTPAQMVEGVIEATADWQFDVVALAYPGVVREGKPAREPHNLGQGWVGFDYEAAFGCPVRVLNDAAMQALGNYNGDRLLFLGLGTGLGTALIVDDTVVALELAHLRWTRKHTYEHYLGKAGRKRSGNKKWRRKVRKATDGLIRCLLPTDVVIGGGEAERLKKLPLLARLSDNAAAFEGGFRVWQQPQVRG